MTTHTKFISSQGYSILKNSLTEKDIKNIKNDLTVTPYIPKDYSIGEAQSFQIYQEGPKKLYVPKFYGLSKFGPPDICRSSDGYVIDVPFMGSLRNEQLPAIDAFMKTISDPHKTGGLLNLTCASGKTVMAIYLICTLKRKSLVIVHKDFLLQQWKERIQQFAPSARIGLLKAKIIDVEDKDIIIASLQSLSMKDYHPDVLNGCGFVIVDECHHTSAEVFSRALRKVAFKYTLGLSATIKRKDGLSKVFKWYLGDVIYSNVNNKNIDTVDIHCRYFYEPDISYSKEVYMMGKKLNMAKMINNICEYTPRIDYIIKEVNNILQNEPLRKIIILSDRRNHLEFIGNELKKHNIEYGFYFGGMKQDDLKESESKQILLGTFCMVSEGFDCKSLDTLILASPKSDVVQSVGRILREEANNRRHVPLVIDIIDNFSVFKKQAQKRIKYYKSQKYNISGLEVVNDNKCIKLDTNCIINLE